MLGYNIFVIGNNLKRLFKLSFKMPRVCPRLSASATRQVVIFKT